MNDYEARFRELLQKRGLTQAELAKQVGKSRQAASTWSHGTLPRDEETLQRLCQILGTTPSYLRYGAGGLPDSAGNLTSSKDSIMLKILRDPDEQLRPAIEVMQVSVAWLRSFVPSSPLDELRLHLVRGDSMAPTAAAGDLLVVDTSVTDYDADDLYLLKNPRGIHTFKRLQMVPDGFNIISDNVRYPPILVPTLTGYNVVGKVKIIGHFFAP